MAISQFYQSWQAVPLHYFLQPSVWRFFALEIPVIALLSFVVVVIAREILSPIRQYRGPFLARWTNLWRFSIVRTGSYHVHIKKLHDIYGPVVRIGPNTLDLDLPELGKTLYGTDGKWLKTEFYHNNSIMMDGKIVYTLFSQSDPLKHAQVKRPIVKYYSQSSVLAQEPLFTKVIGDFCTQLETRFMNGTQDKICDLGEWIAFCAWDVNGTASFSQPFGYLSNGHDFDGSIAIADKALDYFSAVGQMPFLDFLLDKNPIMRLGPPTLENVTRIGLQHLKDRLGGNHAHFNPKVPDYLQHFIDAKNTNPDTVDEGLIMAYLLINLIAGADTSAITMRSVFYYVLKNPAVHRRLEQEIIAANIGPVASYSAARALPYLEAVVREAMRMHPAVGMIMERYVPEEGLTLPDGRFVPAGVAVGINPYVSGRNRDTWGADADVFRPERWLRRGGSVHRPAEGEKNGEKEVEGEEEETEDAYRERMRYLNACDLSFGGGSRICLGRHFANAEVYKVVATLFGRYEIELTDPDREWCVTTSWFSRQRGLLCRLRPRK